MRDIITALVAGAALGAAVNVPWYDWMFPTQPYEQVAVLESGYEGKGNDKYRLKATFLKTDCTFQYMRFFGKTFGEWERVPYADTAEEIGDRLAGWHTFDVYALTQGVPYEEIELRTRHYCTEIVDGKEVTETVDRVFYHATL
jgi:hypothetical protein